MSTADDELVVALARATVERAAPEELVLFPAASEAYLEGRDMTQPVPGDSMLGFGVEAAAVLVTPIALSVARDVLGFLRAQLAKHAEEGGDDLVGWLRKRLFGGNQDDAPAPAESPPSPAELELTDEQLEQVRELALEKAKQLKLADDKAELLADSLVGSLATA